MEPERPFLSQGSTEHGDQNNCRRSFIFRAGERKEGASGDRPLVCQEAPWVGSSHTS